MAFKPTPLTGWWGAGYFISAGAMGGVEEEKSKAEEEEDSRIRVSGFREQDQAALYMQVCGCATQCEADLCYWLLVGFVREWQESAVACFGCA